VLAVQALVGLCVSLYIVIGIGVGVRLLRIAARTRRVPEAALGVTLFCFAALSQPAAVLQHVLRQQDALWSSGAAGIVSWLGTFAALVGLAVFTWQVFRAGERWAAALCAALVALDAVAIGGVMLRIARGQADPVSLGPWIATSCAVFAVVFGWGALEGWSAFVAARRRERVGLADPLVKNRFLLWAVSSSGGLAADVMLIPLMLTGADLTADPAAQLAVAGAALLNAVCWYLAFAPPAFYSRWMAGDAARTTA
jgi:hypothetical protein